VALFDTYLAIDWSARSKPSPDKPSEDSVWVAEYVSASAASSALASEIYFRTRSCCVEYLRGSLLNHVAAGRRVFIGFDFAYGYPTGFCSALGLDSDVKPWRRIWNELSRLICDDGKNHNNRFSVAADLNSRCGPAGPGPFWGYPARAGLPTLKPTQPIFPYGVPGGLALPQLRWAEQCLPGVQSVWKLFYPGNVGSQTLVGIPAVARLRYDPGLAHVSTVWPFETEFTPDPAPARGPYILHAEIWPGVVPMPAVPAGAIRDQFQVRAMVYWLSGLDATNQLGRLFDVPTRPNRKALADCVDEEGWIIGAR
jgi:hypothetical protein